MLRFPRRRLATFTAFTLLLFSFFAIAIACLPDLPALPPVPTQDASDANDTPQFSGCGDFIIETLDDGGVTSETCDPGDASVPGCEACKFVCTGKISDAGHCYFLADDQSSYNNALTACENAGAHVVTFTSQRELDFVNAMVDGGAYWVGLSLQPELDDNYGAPRSLLEPGFPSEKTSCAGCFGPPTDDGGKFPAHPDFDAGGSCLVSEKGAWLRVPTVPGRPFMTVCEREPVGQRLFYCGGPNCTTLIATAGTKRYVLPQALVTEDQAVASCAPYGRLVVFGSNEEREQLAREILNQFSQPVEVWIGLSVRDAGWTWEDDVVALDGGYPLPWAAGEPIGTSGRAYLRISEKDFDRQLARTVDASAMRAVVCERPPP